MAMSKGHGAIQVAVQNVLLDHELSDAPQAEKDRGLGTIEVAGRVFCGDDVLKGEHGWVISEAQRITVSRALHRLAKLKMVIKAKQRAARGETQWTINRKIVIPPRKR